MSLDNLQLAPVVLQHLYRTSLVDLTPANTHRELVSAAEKLNYLGENKGNVVVIVENPAAIYLSDDELNFLIGILSACKLSMADIALVNIHKNGQLNYTAITDQLKAEKILLFGVDPSVLDLPLQFPFYQIQRFNSQVYLSSPELKTLSENRDEKMKLWNCLKQLFSIA